MKNLYNDVMKTDSIYRDLVLENNYYHHTCIEHLIEQKLFDHPDRSLRGRCGKIVGRTISIAHCYHLTGGEGLPRVSGNDDAAEAWWFNLGQIKNMRNEMFEDHFDIINYFLAKI